MDGSNSICSACKAFRYYVEYQLVGVVLCMSLVANTWKIPHVDVFNNFVQNKAVWNWAV